MYLISLNEALFDFAPRVEEFTDQLLDRLRNQQGDFFELFECMMHYSYDVMAVLAFGKPMGFIKREQNDVAQKVLDIMSSSVSIYGLLEHVPWVMPTLSVVTSLGGPLKEWTDWSVSQMKIRMAVSVSKLRNRT
jgi:cytochrome P450